MDHNDCQHCLEISVQNWIRVEIATCWVLIQNTTSHSTWSPAISPQEEVPLWHRFWQGGGFFLCFQMLCDKSSKTSKHHYPTLKKSLDVPTHKLVWISSVTSSPGHAGLEIPNCGATQEHRLLAACSLEPGEPEAICGSHLWKSHNPVSSLKEPGLVPFSEKSAPACRAGFNSYRSRRLRGLFKVNYTKHRADRSQNGKIWGRARRLRATQYSLWLNISNCTIKVLFLGAY